ncbi:MAG: bile acid:sodium symporter family protein [Gammaproteobacteria bacterium]|nr:bile acid:sodium symporter family protein [Gammaproteobacteria bacterium]MCP5137542.1 bile acid:sodium symporter family protein [Gammaproteobacteria bacterium]
MTSALLFPIAAILASVLAYLFPSLFISLKPGIVPLLGLVMFGMGMTLTVANFADVLKRPRLIALGIAMQFAIMPLLAWLLSTVFTLSPVWLIGMILVGASPGGTASNVICYLVRGDVALSITLTTLSTLLAVFLTPLITWGLIGTRIPVDPIAMMFSIAKIVLLPVAAGVLINRFWHTRLARVRHIFPTLSMAAIVTIIAIVVALSHPQLAHIGVGLIVAVALHNLLGLMFGYLIPRTLGIDARLSRTLAIEVGMQNSGLAVALASKFFSPASALPGVLFSIWHNVSGMVIATAIRRHTALNDRTQPDMNH